MRILQTQLNNGTSAGPTEVLTTKALQAIETNLPNYLNGDGPREVTNVMLPLYFGVKAVIDKLQEHKWDLFVISFDRNTADLYKGDLHSMLQFGIKKGITTLVVEHDLDGEVIHIMQPIGDDLQRLYKTNLGKAVVGVTLRNVANPEQLAQIDFGQPIMFAPTAEGGEHEIVVAQTVDLKGQTFNVVNDLTGQPSSNFVQEESLMLAINILFNTETQESQIEHQTTDNGVWKIENILVTA